MAKSEANKNHARHNGSSLYSSSIKAESPARFIAHSAFVTAECSLPSYFYFGILYIRFVHTVMFL